MRFTKIPLIATLMAVALSLLIVLPALAENNERTDGRQNKDSLEIGVFDNITDAQRGKFVDGGLDDSDGKDIFVPKTGEPPSPDLGQTEGIHTAANETAYLANPASSPQDTFFRNTLYVSNNVGAYNTVLISYLHPSTATDAQKATCKTGADAADANVTAEVKNNRSGKTIKLELAKSATTPSGGSDYAQAFFKVVSRDQAPYVDPGESRDTTDDDTNLAYREHDGPTFCAITTTRTYDPGTPNDTSDDSTPRLETPATSAVDHPVKTPGLDGIPLAADAPPAQQEIATIFANHGDRLTVEIGGTSLDVIVDGEGPEFSAVTPEDNASTRGSRLTFSFEVRDEDSGLRHDGQGVITTDGDYKEINADKDQVLDGEPLAVPATSAVPTNGNAADIAVNVAPNTGDGIAAAWKNIGASGSWRNAVSRAGVAYEFSATGGYGDGDYLYQLEAKDRAGNTTTTDAVADEDDNTADEPFVFSVDNQAPVLVKARTGISYDTAKDAEKADRNFIALDFGPDDALASVDTSNITVVGHTIKGVVHPSAAPVINRNVAKATKPAAGDGTKPTPEVAKPPAPSGSDNTSSHILTTGVKCSGTSAISDTAHATPGTPVADDQTYCAWTDYNTKKADYDAYVLKLTAYNNFLQFEKEHPGKDIEGDYITEPRASIYLELAEDLAPDAQPSVIAVGGAVTDLAGNTNEAETLSKGNAKVEDWIAPTLTVTVTGTAADRPVANTKGSFTVDVKADEDLDRRPTVYFVSATATAVTDDAGKTTGYTYKIAGVDAESSLTQQEAEDHWAKKYKTSGLTVGTGLIGVIVFADDAADNSGATAGWTPKSHRNAAIPAVGDKLDLSKLDGAHLLVEVDNDFNMNKKESDDGVTIGTVTPRSNDAGTETESANPFVKLAFTNEKGEYKVGDFKDSHDTVTVSEITLDGVSARANLNRVSATEFSLITRDLAIGKYTVEYKAVDDAGNEYEDKFEFTVKERQPYEISVRPGWNLVSLPATPVDPAIGSVLEGNGYITPVLGYQDGDWLTAIRQDDGTWRGRLTEIEGGYGYWVHARTFESIETMLSEVDPAATLPTVPVTAGWNLLGVLDIFQNDENKAPGQSGGNDEADDYFSSIPWKVAYTYATDKSLWIKTTPKATAKTTDSNGNAVDVQEILNGNGYWVWSTTPSSLVP